MNNAFTRVLSSTQFPIRSVGVVSVSLGLIFFAGCDSNAPSGLNESTAFSGSNSSLSKAQEISSLLGLASTFAVLGSTTVTNKGTSLITEDLGVSPGNAIMGFHPGPINTISGPGTVTSGSGIVTGTIYAGGPVAAQAHNDAVITHDYLVAQTPDTIFSGVTQLNGRTFTPGIYRFAPSVNLQVNGTLFLDFQGNSDALFIFQLGSAFVTMTGSNVIAFNNNSTSCSGSNVYWTVGSSATIGGSRLIGTVIASTTVTMASDANVSGSVIALNGSVTMTSDTVSVCGNSIIIPPVHCDDFVTGGGWINGTSYDKATFGVSGGIKHGEFWGQLSYDDHSRNGVKLKSTSVTSYIYINSVTRQIEGIAKIYRQGSVAYKIIVVDNGEPGHNDSFSIVLSNGYSVSGNLLGGNIQRYSICEDEGNNIQ